MTFEKQLEIVAFLFFEMKKMKKNKKCYKIDLLVN